MSRVMINELEIGTRTVLPAIIQSVSARKTKALKDFLVITAFDGQDTITCNYWDWLGKSMPEVNKVVYDLQGQVTEYLGSKQLTISAIRVCETCVVSDFMPSSGQDMIAIYKEAYQFATDNISMDCLRNVVLGLFEQFSQSWQSAPGAKGVHHAFIGGALIHSLSVAKIAAAAADVWPDVINRDIVVAGSLLHDIGKLWNYSIDGASIVMSEPGILYDHLYMGARAVEEGIEKFVTVKTAEDDAAMQILMHIVLSHHGTLEYGAVVTPVCAEAWLVYYADSIDATCQMIKEASDKTPAKWTDKVWALGNRPMMNYHHMQSITATEGSEIAMDNE